MWCLHINVERVTRFVCDNYNKITSLECCVQNCFFKKKVSTTLKSNKLCFRPNAILFIVILNCSSICVILVAKRMLILMKLKNNENYTLVLNNCKWKSANIFSCYTRCKVLNSWSIQIYNGGCVKTQNFVRFYSHRFLSIWFSVSFTKKKDVWTVYLNKITVCFIYTTLYLFYIKQ